MKRIGPWCLAALLTLGGCATSWPGRIVFDWDDRLPEGGAARVFLASIHIISCNGVEIEARVGDGKPKGMVVPGGEPVTIRADWATRRYTWRGAEVYTLKDYEFTYTFSPGKAYIVRMSPRNEETGQEIWGLDFYEYDRVEDFPNDGWPDEDEPLRYRIWFRDARWEYGYGDDDD